jgi:hypothetical protein
MESKITLSMSILHRSVLRKKSAFLMLFNVLLACIPIAALASIQSTTTTRSLSKANQIKISGRLAEIFDKGPLNAEPSPTVRGVERSVLSAGDGAKWLSPVTVSYKTISNKYCRLAASDINLTTTKVVPLPPSALYDSCLKLMTQYIVDANGDGRQDVAHLVLVKSNRADFAVNEILVYLAGASTETGYCYSAQASRQLSQLSMRSARVANKALREARKRLAIERFACD